jgi:hypothetical protein
MSNLDEVTSSHRKAKLSEKKLIKQSILMCYFLQHLPPIDRLSILKNNKLSSVHLTMRTCTYFLRARLSTS